MNYKVVFALFFLFLHALSVKSQISKTDILQKENDSLKLIVDSITKKSKSELWNLFTSDTIILKQTDEKFGEWGGNISLIKIYRKQKGFSSQFIHKEFIFEDIISGNLSNPKITHSKEYKFTPEDDKLFLNCVYELVTSKIYHLDIPSNYGRKNELYIKPHFNKDSSFFIEIYPADEWFFFHKLKNKILEY